VKIPRFLGEIIFCFSTRGFMLHYEIFRSPCRIQTPSRPVSYTRVWVEMAEKEILRVVASLVVHCCTIKTNVIVASHLYDVADVQFTVG